MKARFAICKGMAGDGNGCSGGCRVEDALRQSSCQLPAAQFGVHGCDEQSLLVPVLLQENRKAYRVGNTPWSCAREGRLGNFGLHPADITIAHENVTFEIRLIHSIVAV